MANVGTDSAFVRRLAAAARAAWWTFLIGAGLATLQFLAYVVLTGVWDGEVWSAVAGLMATEPEVLCDLFLGFMFGVRLILVVLALGAILLSFWVYRLRRVGDA
ncbi:MAG: hypothetical protein NTU94_16150 [Planctomycetota bacterium]|nr:hypothetical protein [Planctomycetota bacterium]